MRQKELSDAAVEYACPGHKKGSGAVEGVVRAGP